MPFWIMLSVIAAIALMGVGGALWIRGKVRRFSRLAFGTDSLLDGLEKQKEEAESAPKTVSGMTSLALPLIRQDFPEFDWPQWRVLCEQEIIHYLEALESHNTDQLDHSMPLLVNQTQLLIHDQQERGIREHYDRIRIHQTAIRDYQRKRGSCVIRVETALEYQYSVSGAQTRPPQRIQTRYQAQLCYIQDVDRMDEAGAELGLGLHCPHCGAPIGNLGQKVCDYCGSHVTPVNVRVWSLLSIKQVGH
ncbi:MAG: hypothetical protein Q4D52_00565 [Eubacteriales bacterium]|nr:hypothetical protein [Eubacteriales bacterium]